ncbi:DUF3887 domain-containing protein [Cryptosporangium phraense]|uniref:Alpha/beta fold hydrolase n=1 Tax=Cryptosporangium phraense TaxID=2593070 RepID=A0A545AH64_9ACTN|nr:DUF3887 domain-containing protein [Cryptosporangium phraense]TQS40666.1 alpha/beta fold hydrolase [Cryptosporangium phraense]
MRRVVEALVAGRFDEVSSMFSPRLRAVVSASALAAAWDGEIARVGAVVSVGEAAEEPGVEGLTRVSTPVTGERGGFTVVMSVDADEVIHGLRLAPSGPTSAGWAPPPYARPTRFVEREILDGAGTLTVPRRRGIRRRSRVGVVLLSGGGPFDRDETSGVNKPLKDLAWGLASQGIAVARFDKPAVEPGWTMSDEYLPRALAAAETLSTDRIYLLGHSMGGRVAPRVAAALPSIAGLILLAADAEPLHHAALRVARHLGWDTSTLERQAALIDSPSLTAATPAADLPFGWPGSYWLDLRDDDPVATAAAVDVPVLLLQGGRDYQVTVDGDLARWRAGLPRAAVRVYDADDHLFFPGSGPSTPAGYLPAQHLDAAVVADVVRWTAGDGS